MVEEGRHVIAGHDTTVVAHALSVFVVQMDVAGAAAAAAAVVVVVVVLAGRQVTDIVAAAFG